MNNNFNIIFYEDNNNKIPVENFIDSLTLKEQQKIIAHIKLLAKYGNRLQRPYSAYLKDKIFELRIPIFRNNYRILYFFCIEKNIILTNGFLKKTNAVPEKEIQKALKYKNDFIIRYERGEISL